MRCHPKLKHRSPLTHHMYRHCTPDCGQKFVNDVVTRSGINRIDYVVLNAGILKYPNVSVRFFFAESFRLTVSISDRVREPQRCNACPNARPSPCLLSPEWFSSFDAFSEHLHTNTVGPIICAQKLLRTGIPIGTLLYMSSDSGSAGQFRGFEDG